MTQQVSAQALESMGSAARQAMAEAILGDLPKGSWGRIWIENGSFQARGAMTFKEIRQLAIHHHKHGTVSRAFIVH